nr:hypothetical protein [uncultured Halomonas sp.]
MTERERFEAWTDGSFELRWHFELGRYASCITQSAWAAWQACCPDGWRCVPIEPTEEMVDAASEMYMPFGDMAIAIQAAIVYAPGVESYQ